jgi:hypothetical protein
MHNRDIHKSTIQSYRFDEVNDSAMGWRPSLPISAAAAGTLEGEAALSAVELCPPIRMFSRSRIMVLRRLLTEVAARRSFRFPTPPRPLMAPVPDQIPSIPLLPFVDVPLSASLGSTTKSNARSNWDQSLRCIKYGRNKAGSIRPR